MFQRMVCSVIKTSIMEEGEKSLKTRELIIISF